MCVLLAHPTACYYRIVTLSECCFVILCGAFVRLVPLSTLFYCTEYQQKAAILHVLMLLVGSQEGLPAAGLYRVLPR